VVNGEKDNTPAVIKLKSSSLKFAEMGGFAAKQRRRVERQSLQRPQNEFNDNKDDKRLPKKRSLKSTGDSPLHRRSQQQPRSNAMSKPMQRSGNTSDGKLPTKTKNVHKPKHLKRKIESISEESTEGRVVKLQEKERLLQQLEEFERRKQQLRRDVQKSPIIMKKVPPIIEDKNIDKIMVKANNKGNNKTTALTDNKVNGRTLVGETLRTKTKHEPVEVISTISSTSTSGKTNLKVTNQLSPVIVSEPVTALTKHNSINRKDDLSLVHSENDDDDDISVTNYNTRQRGKRLRRRGTAITQNQKRSEDTAALQHQSDDVSVVVSSDGVHDDFKNSSISPSAGIATSPNNSNGTEEQKQRRCIGRKPVTDFAVGNYYSGTIVYTKPFGIFVDIGCHYDAFCHVSQLSTVFIENPIDTYPVGTKLDDIHIVEIDRKKKRITISLKKKTEHKQQEEEKPNDTQSNANPSVCIPKTTSSSNTTQKNTIDTKEDGSNIIVDHDNGRIQKIMSTAEQLKRNRKLARRADRRNNQNDS
jgi:predicted RNA-binding protein with RPS1 domain